MNHKMTVEIPEINGFCINCFHQKGHRSLCPQCGYDERHYKNHPLYLKPKTLLQNQYVIGLTLGQGGFGVTYLGQDLWLQKKVAIKEYLPATLATRDVQTSTIIPLKKQENTFNQGLELFIEEARNLAKFDHPNIVRVINFFEENQTGYMVMDYLEGLNPIDFLNKAGGQLSIDEALTIILPILDALAEIHAQKIYHRDISLQNIRILNTGIPVLIDFGAARYIVGEQSHSLDLVLKHGYSPLEQYSGKGKIGPWTDIYACGALLYLMITGTLPPAATDRFCEDNLTAPIAMGIEIATTTNDAIMRALAMKFEDRFQTIQDFKTALQGQSPITINTRSVSSPLPTQPHVINHQTHHRLKKHWSVITATLLFLLAIGISLFFYFQNQRISIKPLWLQAQVLWNTQIFTIPVNENVDKNPPSLSKNVPLSVDESTEKNPPNLSKNALSDAQTKIKQFEMAKHYQQLAMTAQQQGAWKESLTIIQQGLQIMPTFAPLLALEQSVKAHIAEQQKIQETQVKQLLNQATQYLSMSQLQAAYAIYQEVLIIQPNNPLANTGLQQVAEKYLQLAQTSQESISTRLSFINTGLTLFPHHQSLLRLKKALLEEKTEQKRGLEEKQALERQITQWLKKAERQLVALRLTTPKGDNAYETYQKILDIVPHHPKAQAGLNRIADQYERLARIKRDNWQKNLAFIDKGLAILPTHTGLQNLRQTIVQKMQPMTKLPALSKAKSPSILQSQIITNFQVIQQKKRDRRERQKRREDFASTFPKETEAKNPPLSSLTKRDRLTIPTSPPPLRRNRGGTEEQRDKREPTGKEIEVRKRPKPDTDRKTFVADNKSSVPNNTVPYLLSQAQQYLNLKEFEAAYQLYQNVLRIEPSNVIAKNGLQQIARRYEQLAKLQRKQGHLQDSLSFIKKGLAVYPTQSLLALQTEVIRRLNEKTLTKTPTPHLIFTPSF
jgi:serine/threonine protein kinase